MADHILYTEGISIQFGALKAVNHVSINIERGKFTTILGPNGAGKTTLFNLLSGLYKATAGKVFFDGTDITDYTPQQRIHAGLGRSFQLTNVFPRLTVRENIRLAAQSAAGVGFKLFKDHAAYSAVNELTDRLLEQMLLKDKHYLLASDLTHGEQRKLELAMVLALEPKTLLLDEPTAGMSVEEVPAMIDILRDIKATGTTIVLIEHKMNMVKALSDKLIIMVNGEFLVEGDPEAVSANPEVMQVYLGGGAINVTA